MTEENNNQPAIPPNDYQNHLIWRNIFIYIILPIQFIGMTNSSIQLIQEFNEYMDAIVPISSLIGNMIALISIFIVILASIMKKPIGYKCIQFYSIFVIFFKILSFSLGFILLYHNRIASNILVSNIITVIISDTITVLLYIGTAIANLIYFSHRKFLFGIYPEEPTTPVPEQEPKENHQ